ncbi:MAG: hydantoinase B/oxoprolinase family protein [Alphaproteobacteria bacterium]|nr:hydantoinase B/oxoprolinase family protein [Alphaproteobacteria bacterium]
MRPAIDPISFEVIRNALSSIADEMALVIMRSAYSPVVRDSMDYSTALCDRHGQIIAQGLTLAVQLGAFPDTMRVILAQPEGSIRPGDVFISNDPYGSGGQHLPDIYVIKPIFDGEQLEGYACTMAHHCDVGGIAPGSTAMHATDIHQEGLTLPLLKLYEQGRPNETIFRIVEKNTRQPVQVIGDLRAQLAACAIGERGYLELLRRYGGGVALRPYLDELQALAERMMRRFIRENIPDGEYSFTDWIDGIGETPEPLPIRVRVRVQDDEVELDFTGTAPQVPAAINCPIAMIHSASYCAIRCVTSPDIPNCEGYMKPVRIHVPEGTILNPLAPAACAARGVMGYRVFDAIMGALAQAVPDRVIAGGEGGPTLFSIGGRKDGQPFVLTEVMVGTWGARAGKDGVEGISNPAANLSNQPIELIEAELPLEVTRYGLVQDSGGAGERRGGLAFERAFRLLADDAVFTLRADRRDHPPYGLAHAQPGTGSRNVLTSGTTRRSLPTMPMEAIKLRRGDELHHIAAGGGGHGDPLRRDPALVREDVLDEKVSLAAARRDYGVVIDARTLAIDDAATAALRSSRREAAQ